MSEDQTRKITEITQKHQSYQSFQPVRVCAYVRVSTSHDEQMNSLHSQTDYYERRFANNPQYIFTGIFSDAGISGAKENRPGFQAMLEKARAGKIDIIYTKSISRFARNTLPSCVLCATSTMITLLSLKFNRPSTSPNQNGGNINLPSM